MTLSIDSIVKCVAVVPNRPGGAGGGVGVAVGWSRFQPPARAVSSGSRVRSHPVLRLQCLPLGTDDPAVP